MTDPNHNALRKNNVPPAQKQNSNTSINQATESTPQSDQHVSSTNPQQKTLEKHRQNQAQMASDQGLQLTQNSPLQQTLTKSPEFQRDLPNFAQISVNKGFEPDKANQPGSGGGPTVGGDLEQYPKALVSNISGQDQKKTEEPTFAASVDKPIISGTPISIPGYTKVPRTVTVSLTTSQKTKNSVNPPEERTYTLCQPKNHRFALERHPVTNCLVARTASGQWFRLDSRGKSKNAMLKQSVGSSGEPSIASNTLQVNGSLDGQTAAEKEENLLKEKARFNMVAKLDAYVHHREVNPVNPTDVSSAINVNNFETQLLVRYLAFDGLCRNFEREAMTVKNNFCTVVLLKIDNFKNQENIEERKMFFQLLLLLNDSVFIRDILSLTGFLSDKGDDEIEEAINDYFNYVMTRNN